MTESEQQDMELLIERNTILQQQYKDVNEFKIKLLEENAQLKELLKKCRSPINYALCLNLSEEEKIEFKNLLAKINQELGDK